MSQYGLVPNFSFVILFWLFPAAAYADSQICSSELKTTITRDDIKYYQEVGKFPRFGETVSQCRVRAKSSHDQLEEFNTSLKNFMNRPRSEKILSIADDIVKKLQARIDETAKHGNNKMELALDCAIEMKAQKSSSERCRVFRNTTWPDLSREYRNMRANLFIISGEKEDTPMLHLFTVSGARSNTELKADQSRLRNGKTG